MAKDLRISMLLDFYGNMLTDKQREVVEAYYNDDLSLSEIASNSNITRQGVRDSIKRAEVQLIDLEEKLGMMQKFREVQSGLDQITQYTREVRQCLGNNLVPKEIEERLQAILKIAGELNE